MEDCNNYIIAEYKGDEPQAMKKLEDLIEYLAILFIITGVIGITYALFVNMIAR